MRPKSMILIVIALGCGLVASIGISQVIKSDSNSSEIVETETIYVAAKDIDLGSLLDETMVKGESWPKDKVPQNAVRSLDELASQRALARLYKGQIVVSGNLIDKDKYHDATMQIPEGYRVVTIGVNSSIAVANLVKPGDQVDIIFFVKGGKTGLQTKTRTILRGIKVFAVNTKLERESQGENEVIKARNVSLLVKPQQVQKIMLASEIGHIRLSLRRSDDKFDEEVEDTTIADLLGDDADSDLAGFSAPDDPVDSSESKPSGVASFLEVMKSSQAEETDSNHGWEMTILGQDGNRVVYEWSDVKKLPTRQLPGGGLLNKDSHEDFGDAEESASDVEEDWEDSNPLESLLN